MIDYIKDNYLWLGAIVIPIVVVLIEVVAALVKKSGRNQTIRDVKGDSNTIINGDVKKHFTVVHWIIHSNKIK